MNLFVAGDDRPKQSDCTIQKPQNYVYETNFYILTKNINYIMFLYVTILSNPKYNSKYTPDTVTTRLFLSIILYYTEMLGQKASELGWHLAIQVSTVYDKIIGLAFLLNEQLWFYY